MNWEEKTSIRLVGGHPDQVNDIAFSSGDTFAVAIEDGSLRLWNYGKYTVFAGLYCSPVQIAVPYIGIYSQELPLGSKLFITEIVLRIFSNALDVN